MIHWMIVGETEHVSPVAHQALLMALLSLSTLLAEHTHLEGPPKVFMNV